MARFILFPLLALIGLSVLQAQVPTIRTWTTVEGKTAEARLLMQDKEQVLLGTADGKSFRIPRDELGEADLRYLATQPEDIRHIRRQDMVEGVRVWKLTDGRSLEAKFGARKAGRVLLLGGRGQRLQIPFRVFSETDRAVIDELFPLPEVKPDDRYTTFADSRCEDDPTTTSLNVKFWMPFQRKPISGILMLLPPFSEDGMEFVDDKKWRALAAKHNYAIAGMAIKSHRGWVKGDVYYDQPSKGSGKTVLAALDTMAEKQKRPEISTVPIVVVGEREGGDFAYNFANWAPDRVQAYAAIKPLALQAGPGAAVKKIPGLFVEGKNQPEPEAKRLGMIFENNRRRGGQVGLLRDAQGVNIDPATVDVVRDWLDVLLLDKEMRAQFRPVIGQQATGKLYPLNEKLAKNPGASWFPDRMFGEIWSEKHLVD